MSAEYRSVPLGEDNEDGGFADPIVRAPKRLSSKQLILIGVAIAVCLYLGVMLVGGPSIDMNDMKNRAKNVLTMSCPNPELDSTLTADQRIDKLMYRSLKLAIVSGDEVQAQNIAKQLVQSFKANQDAASLVQSTPDIAPIKHDNQPTRQPTKQVSKSDNQSSKPATPLDYESVNDGESLDDAVNRIVGSKSMAEWEKIYENEDVQSTGWIKRDGWHVSGTAAFTAPGCQPLGEQCSTPSPKAAEQLCNKHEKCLGYVCSKSRSDCQLRVAPLVHNQQDNIVGYYKNAKALAGAEIREKESKTQNQRLMKPGSTASKGFNFKGVCGKNGYKCVISYGLYGSNPKYGEGAIENVKLLDAQFPGWIIRIYHDATVPQELLIRLAEMGCELNHVDSAVESGSIAGMFWRFLIAEDETVDRYIIRDTDSRLNPREKAAVDEWLASGYSIHTIRDHPNHDRPLNGGMWGGSKGSLLNIRQLIASSGRDGYGADLTFLNEKVWPLIQYDQIGHDSYSCHHYINSFPFPTKRPDDYQHVGQVFEDNKPRMGDITGFLMNNPAPMQCRKHPDWIYG